MRMPHSVYSAIAGLLLYWMIGTAAPAQDDSQFDIAGLQALQGTVTRIAGSTVYVKLRSGKVVPVATGPNTHFVKEEQTTPTDPAKPGDTVLAGGEMDPHQQTLGAVFVAVVDAAELATLNDRRAQFGKTWIAGTILAKAGTTLQLKLPDGSSAQVEVNEDTSFHKHHQSIVYPDLHVGDGITATGQAQRNHVFVARLLTVVDAAMIREWGRLQN